MLIRSEDKTYRSLYRDELADEADIRNAVMTLSSAFPLEDKEERARFFALLCSRMKANGFTKQRMQDAVNYLVDNFRYKQINIADVITYDRRVRLYTYQEYCSAVYRNKNLSDDFEFYAKIDDVCFWYRKSELAKLKAQ